MRKRMQTSPALASRPESVASHVPAMVLGEVMHRRSRPVVNVFTYPAFCLRLPLSQLPSLPARGLKWNAGGVVSFHDRDHGPRDGSSLDLWVRQLLAAEGVAAPAEIVLHAFPRMLGYVFNPVSFWVAHNLAGGVIAVVAEVNNTFGETHLYLVTPAAGGALRSGETLHARKAFHVSPFCRVTGDYAFRFHFAADRWLARIDYFAADGSAALIETHISGRVVEMTKAAVRALPWRYPMFTLGVIARIHWQALKLWARRVPVETKPPPPAELLTR
jgi:DUF1365 family protein